MNLKTWLVKNKMSVVKLANKMAISRGHLHHVMAGNRGLSKKNMEKLSKITGKVFTKENLLWQKERIRPNRNVEKSNDYSRRKSDH